MSCAPSAALNPSGQPTVTILVLGDGHNNNTHTYTSGVGKTSLISSLVSENFNDRVPPVLQAVMVPSAITHEGIPITIIDTSSDPAHETEITMHLGQTQIAAAATTSTTSAPSAATAAAANAMPSSKASLLADAVLLVVSADIPDSFSRVESYWLPLIESYARPTMRIPVVLAINKSSQEDGTSAAVHAMQHGRFDHSYSSPPGSHSYHPHHPISPHRTFEHLIHGFRISAIIPCSAKYMYNLSQCFFECTKVILSPIEPLFDLHAAPSAKSILASAGGGSTGTVGLASAIPPQPTMKFKITTQKALLRIFRLFDRDHDGIWSFTELDAFHQVGFKGKKLSISAFSGLMSLLQGQGPSCGYVSSCPHGLNGVGVTFAGLLFFEDRFLKKDHHLWGLWTLLRQFGYEHNQNNTNNNTNNNNTIQAQTMMNNATQTNSGPSPSLVRGNSIGGPSAVAAAAAAAMPPLGSIALKDSYSFLPFPYQPLCAYELTPLAIDFLTGLFKRFDTDRDGLISIRTPHAANTTAAATVNGNESHVYGLSSASSSRFLPTSLPPLHPSSICSLSASSDLENIFLTAPDIPFHVATFAKFLPPSAKGSGYINLDAWLAAWAMMLWNCSNTPITINTSVNVGPPYNPHTAPTHATPTPELVLRYIAYLCFPVTPAFPEFTMSTNAAQAGSSSAHAPKVKTYLPHLTRCLHLTPRNVQSRPSIDAAISCNDLILSSDPSSSSSSRGPLSDSASWKPRTVMCHVVGLENAGKRAFIECMIGMPPMAGSNATQTTSIQGLTNKNTPSAAASNADTKSNAAEQNATSTPTYTGTYATRLPLAHIPPAAAHAYAASAAGGSASSSSSYSSSAGLPHLDGVNNRFLILKEVSSKHASDLLSSPSFTSTSGHLLLLCYDGTSKSSLQFVKDLLPICFMKHIPVLVIQTRIDCIDCSSTKLDFMDIDYNIHIEPFSSKIFWTGVQQIEQALATTHMMHVFQRIHQAAAQPSHRNTHDTTHTHESQVTRFLPVLTFFLPSFFVVLLLSSPVLRMSSLVSPPLLVLLV